MANPKGQTKADRVPKDIAVEQRRRFLKRAGKVAATAPAVALLLSVDSKRAAHADATITISGQLPPSDRRLKRGVRRVGALPNGLPLYSFRYVWGGPMFVGVMAQDALGVAPEAVVTGPDGFYRVDYEKLGTRMMTLSEWCDTGLVPA